MKYGITLIPGDGIGTEVSEAAVRVVEACGLDIEWDRTRYPDDSHKYTPHFTEPASSYRIPMLKQLLKGRETL